MVQYTRRTWIGRNIAFATAGGAASVMLVVTAPGAEAQSAYTVKKGKIKLALVLGNNKSQWKLARQIGVNHAIIRVSGTLSKISSDQYVNALKKIKAEYEEAGISIAGVESHPVPADRIRLGVPGRDEEIANYRAAIEALGKVGIPMCCYHFMARDRLVPDEFRYSRTWWCPDKRV